MKCTWEIEDGRDRLRLTWLQYGHGVNIERDGADGVVTVTQAGFVEMLRNGGFLPNLGWASLAHRFEPEAIAFRVIQEKMGVPVSGMRCNKCQKPESDAIHGAT